MIWNFAKLRGLAASGRVANLPSVISNVFVGMAVAAVHVDQSVDAYFWKSFFLIALSSVCLYLAGNFLNDCADLEWDVIHRPERALPMGLFSARFYAGLFCLFALSGLSFAAWVGFKCGIISGMILCLVCIYTYWHKKSTWSVIPMGLCRGLLPVLGFYAMDDHLKSILPVALGLFCYVVGLSINARFETQPDAPLRMKTVSWSLFFGAAIGVLCGVGDLLVSSPYFWVGVLPYGVWVIFCLAIKTRSVSNRISNLLAGIPWVDWMMLLPLGLTMMWEHSSMNSLTLACLWISPMAFLCGKLLQRFTPAS